MSNNEVQKRADSKLKESLLQKDGGAENKAKAYQAKLIMGMDGNLVALSVMNFFLNAAVSVIVPFYPPLATEQKGVSQSMVGFIFALNPIGSFSVSMFIGQMMGKLGKKNLMYWGLAIQTITIFSFGFVYYIDNNTAFILISMFVRFLQGASRSAYGAATFGFVPQLWPTTVQKKIGIMETMTAIGLVLGPMIGTAIHNMTSSESLGYQLPFYILGTVFALCIYTVRWLPPDIKMKVDLDKVKAIDCIKNPGIFWTFMVMVACAVGTCYINPQYTVHMKALGLGDDTSGYLVTVSAFFYMIFLHLMPSISKKLDKKLILIMGLFLSIISSLVQGPEKYFGLPLGGNRWYLVTIGMSINGIGSAMAILPMIPELIELIVKNEMKNRKLAVPDAKLIRACSDMGSSIFVGGYALGTFVGPFFGGLLYQNLPDDPITNFMNESRIFAGFILVVMLCYIGLGNGYLGISATLKKLNWFQPKRAHTKNSDSVIQTRRAEQGINTKSCTDSQPNTLIDNNAVKGGIGGGDQVDDFERSEVSDELLSDHSPIDILSQGSGSDDIEDNPRMPIPRGGAIPKGGEKDIFYFE